MVWAGVCYGQQTQVHFIHGILNAQRYRDDIVRPIVVPFIHDHHLMLQHDNARPHVARICTQFLEAENIPVIAWPAYSPDIYSTRLTRKALCIAGDPTHPTHSFFRLLPSGRRLRSLQARTSRLKDSFIHQAVRKLNRTFHPPPPHPPPPTPTYKLITTSSSIDCKLPLSDSLIKDCSLSSYHFNRLISSFALHIISAQFCLFNWFALFLPCDLCHFISLFFSTMSSFVYLYSLYVHV